ncbi:aminotransferase class I/II-fold pyridoxal phosphate-dependent enzyme [Crenobacter intestini]|uniref:Putative 8-amino-7-oxononanoate synthase n=1 Tax=Crenobacter intestini TaxID=2563443 RepID=A0A4T0UTM6_9NEIS|nr:aminotransferase class I/II-fold pyridoxal phosphate-dependent enzyme [Crenobacter intestini]TIC82127.1 aminotransferase class I/II-fold pyridoxal phosphate-dependent enzyme [Crenobacter intestini]
MQLAARLAHIAPFEVMAILERARALEAAGRDVIHLEIGEPDFPTPQPIIDAAQAALCAGQTFYTPAQGLPALREAIAADYRRQGVELDPARVIVTPGASGALLIALSLLVSPGDGVLLADPTYPCNRHFVHLLGGDVQSVAVGPATRYQLDAALAREAWREHTRALMVATPANPTGTSLDAAEVAALGALCKERGAGLIVDEIYQGLSYDGAPVSALAVAPDALVINSFSKTWQMTGFRLGYLVVPDALVEPAIRLAQNLFLCPSAIAQQAALAAFTPEVAEEVERRRQVFAARRDFLLAALPRLGWQLPVRPDGAFYVYADVSAVTGDSYAYCARILEEANVALTPGTDFGTHRAGAHLRIAYTTGIERLAEAIERIAALGARSV